MRNCCHGNDSLVLVLIKLLGPKPLATLLHMFSKCYPPPLTKSTNTIIQSVPDVVAGDHLLLTVEVVLV